MGLVRCRALQRPMQAYAKADGPASGEGQASSSSSVPGGVPAAGSPALNVPMDAGSPASLGRQDEVSAMDGQQCSCHRAHAWAEHEDKRQRTDRFWVADDS